MRRALLTAVRTQPDDDTLRLILADLLDERAHSHNEYLVRSLEARTCLPSIRGKQTISLG